MLKGILFVIAIIITFDIGKALIDSWNSEENSIASSEEVKQKDSELESQIKEAEKQKSEEEGEKVPVILDLSLPPGLSEDEELEVSLENEQMIKTQSKSTESNKEKRMTLNAKPIVKFDEEGIEKPAVEGAEVGVKIKLN